MGFKGCNLYIYHFLGTKACEKVVDLINNTRLLRDVKKLSTLHQTSNLEAFHSLVCQFAPKMGVYSFRGMLVR